MALCWAQKLAEIVKATVAEMNDHDCLGMLIQQSNSYCADNSDSVAADSRNWQWLCQGKHLCTSNCRQ